MQEFHLGDGTEGPYSGYPRPELEEAWGKLLGSTSYPKRLPNAITHYFDHSDMNIRLALEDLKVFNRDQDAVALPDGSGYIGTLNIYHEIHCVVSVQSMLASIDQQLMIAKEMAAYPHVPRALLSKP